MVNVAAFVDREVIGTSDIFRRRAADERHIGLSGIVVLTGYREEGIGQTMVKTVLKEALRSGVRPVEIKVLAINEVAIHVYKKLGFRRVRVVPGKMLRNGRLQDEICMYVDLRQCAASDMDTQIGAAE